MKKKILLVIMVLFIAVYPEEKIAEEKTAEVPVSEGKKSEEPAAVDKSKPEPVAEKETVKETVNKEKVSESKERKAETGQGNINIAVLDLDNRSNFSSSEIKLFTDRVNFGIMKVDRFVVIERQLIDEILNEQGFQQSGACSNQECLLEVGQLLAVEKVIGGSIGKVEDMYPVTLKIIDVATGKIETQVVRDFEGKKSVLLSEFIPKITNELLHEGGYIEDKKEPEKKKSLFAKPGFIIPAAIAVVGGAAAAIILIPGDNGGAEEEAGVDVTVDVDISDFPDHEIPIQ